MIHVPYIDGMLRDETLGALAHDVIGHVALLDQLEERDDAYYDSLVSWWDEPEDLIIVEQDMVPANGVIQEMLECNGDWCTSPYLVAGVTLIHLGLGCVKFSEQLRRDVPDAAREAGIPRGEDEPFGTWKMLDARLAPVLQRAGYHPHLHQESIHLHY